MSDVRLSEEGITAFVNLLAAHRSKRIHWESIWACFAEAFPHRPMGRIEREWLHAALEDLRSRGLIAYPSERGHLWDRSTHPILPQVVIRVEERGATDQPWRSHPWHPELAWVPTLARLTPDQEFFLHRVHEGLVEGWFKRPAPLRYRSLQLTGSEKRLERHIATVLFAVGRLSIEMLNIYHDVLPLAWERVGPGGAVLIFENSAPFSVARGALSSMERPPYGIVAYGGGRAFTQSVAYLLTIGSEITAIDYVGDLDSPGLDIAMGACETARRTGILPEVRPAPGFHRMMLEAAARFGHPDGWPDPDRLGLAPPPVPSFLPSDVRAPVHAILTAGNRIPEEVLGPEEMRTLWEV